MTAQPITRPTAGAADSVPGTTRNPATVHTVAGATRPAAGRRGRALLAVLGLALAAAVLPATAVHASPQSPEVGGQLANLGGNPQPPEPPDVPDWGPDDVANPTENPEPPLPPEPPDNGPDDLANPTENPDPPQPPNPNPDSTDSDSIPTPQRVDAGFGGTAAGPQQVAGLALIAAGLVLAALVIMVARRRTGTRSTR